MFTPVDSQAAVEAIQRWILTARDEIDDIGSWRGNTRELSWRGWPERPSYHDLPTTGVTAWMVNHHPTLDPKPVLDVHEAISAWYEDCDALRLPDQAVLLTTFDRAFLLLAGVWSAAQTKTGPVTSVQATDGQAMMAARDLARLLGVNQDALEKCLTRWREKNKGSGDFMENAEPRAHDPRYLYRVSLVMQIAKRLDHKQKG